MTLPLLAMGGSLGSMRALASLLPELGSSCPAATVVVVHRAMRSDGSLVALLQRSTPMPVAEAEDGMPLLRGHVLVAPPDYHLFVDEGRCSLSIDAPVKHSRPSIDLCFESVARWRRGRVLGVLLTGASEDGARGLAAIEAGGGLTFVQSPGSAEAPRMPSAALASCRPVAVGTPDEIGRAVARRLAEAA